MVCVRTYPMTTRTYTVTKKNPKHSQEWSWEETPELLTALEKLHESSELAASLKERPKTVFKTPNAAPSKGKTQTVDKVSTKDLRSSAGVLYCVHT